MKRRSNLMLLFIIIILLAMGTALFANLFMISIVGYHLNSDTDLKAYSNNVNVVKRPLVAKRGMILDRNGEIIAQDVESYTLYAIVDETRPSYKDKPSYVVDHEETARQLATVLDAPVDYILGLLDSADYQTEFGIYGSNLSQDTKLAIEQLGLPGLGFIKEFKRVYPMNVFASSLIGFVGETAEGDSNLSGKMGIESAYETVLAGTDGTKVSVVDRYGYSLLGYPETIEPAEDGSIITLTLDRMIQEQLETSFLITKDTFDSTEMFGAVMEVKTGKLLAVGQYPTFDPNKMDVSEFRNFATQYVYEPGSTMKTFTYAAAIDTGVYDGNATFNSVPFKVSVNKNADPYRASSTSLVIGTIRNAHNRSWGVIDYDTGYAYSSNVGIASLLTTRLDLEVFKTYLIRFGFNDSVKVDDLPESTGVINFSWPYEKLTVGFGQGITVNMMQMMQAYSAIMNDGTMVKPYIVDSIVNPTTHEVITKGETEIVGQPIKAETAAQMVDLMYKVSHDPKGTALAYNVDEVEIIAKTGTAQIYKDGAYSDDEFLYSVMIGLPADDPEIMIYYAYRAPATLNAHYKTDAIQQLLHQVALVYNFRKSDEPVITEISKPLSSFELPNFINHSLNYAKDYLSDKSSDVTVIGQGSSILDQYPNAMANVLSTQPIYLLTDKNDLTMPDLIGRSRKDVLAYFKLIGLEVSIQGEGYVIEQTIVEGTPLTSDTVVEVTLG